MLPRHKNRLEPGVRHVLLTLSTFANENGDSCFPSLRRLAEATSLSRNTVTKRLAIAQAGGWLVVEENRGFGNGKRGRRGKGWKRSAYVLTIPSDLHDDGFGNNGGVVDDFDEVSVPALAKLEPRAVLEAVLRDSGFSESEVRLHQIMRKAIA